VKKNNVEKKAKELCSKLLSLMGIKAKLKTSLTKAKAGDEEVESINVQIVSEEEKGLLIGRRGSTLMAIQAFLGMALRQELGRWVRVLVDIGDWREKQEEYLQNLALHTAQRARETGEPQQLFNLTSSQRRVIHLVLAKEKDVETESQGEDEERYLIVRPKK